MEFALEYYEMMFSSDDEVHSIWNATLKTTTKIIVSEDLLFVDTFEYVDGEEQGAQKLFSGVLLDSRIIDLKAGQLFEESTSEAVPDLKVISPATTSTARSNAEKPATNKDSGTWGEDSTTNEITGSTSRTAY